MGLADINFASLSSGFLAFHDNANIPVISSSQPIGKNTGWKAVHILLKNIAPFATPTIKSRVL